MKLSDLLFSWEPPPDWETRVQVTFVAPPVHEHGLPATQEQVSAPRRNVVISRVPTELPSALKACEEFLDQTTKAVPQFESKEIDRKFPFDDDVVGVSVEVTFPATPQVRLIQLHGFRIDNGILTQLVATFAESEEVHRQEELKARVKKFRSDRTRP